MPRFTVIKAQPPLAMQKPTSMGCKFPLCDCYKATAQKCEGGDKCGWPYCNCRVTSPSDRYQTCEAQPQEKVA